MKTLSYITLYEWKEKWYNRFGILLNIPSLQIGKYVEENCMSDEPVVGLDLEFETKITYKKTWYSWNFMFKILGFGITIYRQWSY
jgi:hypothetical protein